MKWLPDVVGLAGYVVTVVGVLQVFGGGWACIVGGAPIAALYVWREVRIVWRVG